MMIPWPGIPRNPLDNEAEVTAEQALELFKQGKSCTYLGIHSGRFVKGTSFNASLVVPSGSERYVQVIGIRDTRTGAPACGVEFLKEQADSSSERSSAPDAGAGFVSLAGQPDATLSRVENPDEKSHLLRAPEADDSFRLRCPRIFCWEPAG